MISSTANLIPRPKNLITDEEQQQDEISGEKTRNNSSGRSAALERAYVHDVYENCVEPTGSIRPKVAQFLAALEPSSLVCDVGCGNGRYLNSCNPLIYTLGIDRCYRLAKLTKSKGGEVALCDNLELPFRDETFDAVLSVAVVHHFATTERRVGAIRELARILRIGGRVIITVWALEQKQRRFESQDVLIPWQPPKSRSTNISDDEDEEDFLPPYHAYTEDSTNSSRSAGDGDSSSLSSSPGESCYSFVRRAIQKLAGGKRHPWFLDSWNSKDTKNGSSLDYEDAKDLPIELRRLEDFEDFPEPPLSAGLKSRSLGSILNPPPRQIVRSRSSVPSLGAQIPENKPAQPSNDKRRPKLVKQKQSIYDEAFVLPEENFPDEAKPYLRKQSSLNEELMAENRIREKERVRKRIQKQISLNEAFLCRSVFTKRLQVIREGFTSKLKTSTGSLERVTKNSLEKIMQNFKTSQESTETVVLKDSTQGSSPNVPISGTIKYENNNEKEPKTRRHSRESGSDSSKENSLTSDTSIDEDSFASVIFVGNNKPEQQPNNEPTNNIRTPSVPTSPLTMTCPTPAHSPAPLICKLQTKSSVDEAPTRFPFDQAHIQQSDDSSKNFLNQKLSPKFQRITKQIVNNLPQIPKFKRAMKFPMVRRTNEASPAVPKLAIPIEIFNPETDDLDSDSSEPSSPDSIDSVISVPKPIKANDNDSQSVNSSDNVEATKSPTETATESESNGKTNGDADDVNFVNRQHLVDFAEKLSAQLLKELDGEANIIDEDIDQSISDIINDKQSIFNLDDPYIKKLNGEMKDLNSLREELRERRLMLANLNMHQYQNNSTSSTIKEEDELSPKNEPESDEHRVISNYDMALLIEEDTENENDDDDTKFDGPKTNGSVKDDDHNSADDHDDDDQKFCQDDIASIINSNDNLNVSLSSQQSLNISNASSNAPGLSDCKRKRSQQRSSESKDSWPHSNSTASLDSPSVGGSSTHHRYYHVFREGELDALVEHVASLHIVSSYYERASWCVVAEKVQVWTI
ncbi:hypothetical protein HA402_010322 [Bradysia odoriphaga]|nr:hypothetical protein HA402_010322 [Bradysia odoriphaga]